MVLVSARDTNGAAFVRDQLSAEVSGCWLSAETPFRLPPSTGARINGDTLSPLRFYKTPSLLTACLKTVEYRLCSGGFYIEHNIRR